MNNSSPIFVQKEVQSDIRKHNFNPGEKFIRHLQTVNVFFSLCIKENR